MAMEATISSTASARPGLPGVIVAATVGTRLSSPPVQNTCGYEPPMSALPPKADIGTQPRDVRFVPKALRVPHSMTFAEAGA